MTTAETTCYGNHETPTARASVLNWFREIKLRRMPGARITPSPPKTPTPPVNKPLIESPETRIRELHNIDEKLIRDVVTMNPSGSSPNASSTCGSYGPRQCTTVNSTGRNRSQYLGQRLKNYSRVDTATVGFFAHDRPASTRKLLSHSGHALLCLLGWNRFMPPSRSFSRSTDFHL